MVKDNFIQLTPDEVSQSGAIWNQKANSMVDWEVVIGFVVGKATATLGADGLTFWYTKRPGKIGNISVVALLTGTRFGVWQPGQLERCRHIL